MCRKLAESLEYDEFDEVLDEFQFVLQQSRDNYRGCLDGNFKFSRNRETLLSIYQLPLRLSRFVSAHHRDTYIETTQCSIPNLIPKYSKACSYFFLNATLEV